MKCEKQTCNNNHADMTIGKAEMSADCDLKQQWNQRSFSELVNLVSFQRKYAVWQYAHRRDHHKFWIASIMTVGNQSRPR